MLLLGVHFQALKNCSFESFLFFSATGIPVDTGVKSTLGWEALACKLFTVASEEKGICALCGVYVFMLLFCFWSRSIDQSTTLN